MAHALNGNGSVTDLVQALEESKRQVLRDLQGGWGQCLACSLRARRCKFGQQGENGSGHFGTKGHLDAEAWLARKVAVATGGPAVGPTSPAPAASGASLSPVARAPSVRVFRPTGVPTGVVVSGAFLVDSFYYFKGSKGTREYMTELLTWLFERTGLNFVAVCSGGAALVTPQDPRSATYEELLMHVPAGVRVVIAVVCGNDLLSPSWRSELYQSECDAAVRRLCAGMQEKALAQFAVVGGSGVTWGYASSCRASYDAESARCSASGVGFPRWGGSRGFGR